MSSELQRRLFSALFDSDEEIAHVQAAPVIVQPVVAAPSPERAMPPGGSSLQMPDLLAPPAALPAVPAPVASELAVPGAEAAPEPAAAHGAKTVVEMIAIMDKARVGALTAKAKKGAQKKALQKKPAAAKAKKPAAAGFF